MKSDVKSVSVSMKLENQKMENLQSLLKKLGGKGGCDACGRIAKIAIEFGDPIDQAFIPDGVANMQINGV